MVVREGASETKFSHRWMLANVNDIPYMDSEGGSWAVPVKNKIPIYLRTAVYLFWSVGSNVEAILLTLGL